MRLLGSIVASFALLASSAGLNVALVNAQSPVPLISADLPWAVPAGHTWAYNDFFPRTLQVATGSTVRFAIGGFHTATLLPLGETAAQDLATNGVLTADEDPGHRANGTTGSELNLPALAPTGSACGSSVQPCAFDGNTVVSSGVSLATPTGPFSVQISAPPGTYVFHCRIHAGMAGQIDVLPADAQGSTPAQLAASTAIQLNADIAAGLAAETKAEQASQVANPDGTTTWYVSAGTGSVDGRVAVNEFLPRDLNIQSGDEVVWRPHAINEFHSVTFAPGGLTSDFVPLCEGSAGDTPAMPNTSPPNGPLDYHCGQSALPDEVELGGGDGVRNLMLAGQISDSGIFATRTERAVLGLPTGSIFSRWSVSFVGASPGSFSYVCQVHFGMTATIEVH